MKPDGALAIANTKDIVGQFSYVVETERRFYLANSVEMVPRNTDGEATSSCGWLAPGCGTCTSPAQFVKQVRSGHVQGRQHRGSRKTSCACRVCCPKRRHTSIGCVRQSVGRGWRVRR